MAHAAAAPPTVRRALVVLPRQHGRVDITLLYFDDCPGWEVADGRLGEALRIVGLDPTAVERRQITTDEEAQRARFRGSPTILLDGVDPFLEGDAGPFGLSCRLYPSESGLAGSPTLDQLVEVLRARLSPA